MQNHNVSGSITTSTGSITSTPLGGGDYSNNDSGHSAIHTGNKTAGSQSGGQNTREARPAGMQQVYESGEGDDGMSPNLAANSADDADADEPVTARPVQRSGANGSAGAGDRTYDRLAVNPLGLHLRSDPSDVTRGRGVFSDRRIPAGTLIEEAPVLIITKGQWDAGKMDDCILGEYGFCWTGGGQGIGLGLASLFNHSSSPNVNFIRQPATSTIKFITSRTVEADEELCICYSADESKLWFTPSGRASPAPSSSSSQEQFPALISDDMFDAQQIAEREKRLHARAERKRLVALSDQEKARPRRKVALRDRALLSDSQASGLGAEMQEDLDPGNLRAQSASPAPSSTSSYPSYPTPAERPSNDLPPPLHTDGALVEDPIDLCAELDWTDEEWAGRSQADVPSWGIAKRVKGPTELEEDAADAALMEVWVIAVQAQRDTRLALEFVRDQLPADGDVKHLKKVARRSDPAVSMPGTEGPVTMVVLCSTSTIGLEELVSSLGAYHPSLVGLAPFRKTVPAGPARTQEQLALKSPHWPVAFVASIVRPSDSTDWSASRVAWVQAGLRRCVAIAREAKSRGELPVGVYCVSPPESLWPTVDGFVPPTASLRASGYDTRISANHPLKHAAFNCIRNIATIRTQPPFSEMQATRNGGDYLLTSMSLFVTHEPCPMCCMALLHSRVREVFYLYKSKRGGGFESAFGVHGRRDLNHRFEVWRYEGEEVEGWREELAVGDEYAL